MKFTNSQLHYQPAASMRVRRRGLRSSLKRIMEIRLLRRRHRCRTNDKYSQRSACGALAEITHTSAHDQLAFGLSAPPHQRTYFNLDNGKVQHESDTKFNHCCCDFLVVVVDFFLSISSFALNSSSVQWHFTFERLSLDRTFCHCIFAINIQTTSMDPARNVWLRSRDEVRAIPEPEKGQRGPVQGANATTHGVISSAAETATGRTALDT